LLANGATLFFIAGRYGTTSANLRNWMKKNGISRFEQERGRAA